LHGAEDQAEIGPVGLREDAPGVLVAAHHRAGGERLVADPEPPLSRHVRQQSEIGSGAVGIVHGVGPGVGAHHQERRADLLREIEKSGRAGEVPVAKPLRSGLEVAQRLEGEDFQPEIGGEPAHLCRCLVTGDQVLAEDFDAVIAGPGCCLDLAVQWAGEAKRGDPALHCTPPW